MLLGDDSGRLIALGWEYEKSDPMIGSTPSSSSGTVLVKRSEFGATSPASSLVYLNSGHIFIASACGDSLVMQLQGGRTSTAASPRRVGARPIPTPRKGKARARDNEEEDIGGWSVVEDTAEEGRIDIKERWLNLAPVKDFCTVEEEGGGVSHLVVASGASTSNSLRIVRSGVGLEDLLHLEGFEDVRAMWTLPTQ